MLWQGKKKKGANFIQEVQEKGRNRQAKADQRAWVYREKEPPEASTLEISMSLTSIFIQFFFLHFAP